MKNVLVLIAALALSASAMNAEAAACRDAKGKFVKCPTVKAVAKAAPCRDASGAFAKCGAPAAHTPALAKATTPKAPTAH